MASRIRSTAARRLHLAGRRRRRRCRDASTGCDSSRGRGASAAPPSAARRRHLAGLRRRRRRRRWRVSTLAAPRPGTSRCTTPGDGGGGHRVVVVAATEGGQCWQLERRPGALRHLAGDAGSSRAGGGRGSSAYEAAVSAATSASGAASERRIRIQTRSFSPFLRRQECQFAKAHIRVQILFQLPSFAQQKRSRLRNLDRMLHSGTIDFCAVIATDWAS